MRLRHVVTFISLLALSVSLQAAVTASPNTESSNPALNRPALSQVLGIVEQAKLTASDGVEGDGFGGTLAVSGDTLAVVGGAEVYVFVKPPTGWQDATETARLHVDHYINGFNSLAIEGDTIVAGEGFCGEGYGHNNVYVFVKPAGGWSDMAETATLFGSDLGICGSLGRAVAISGNFIVASAGYPDDGDKGQLYFFMKPANGWHDEHEFTKVVGPDYYFGFTLALQADTLVVGDFQTQRAYVYSIANGQVKKLAELTSPNGGDFPQAIIVQGNTIVADATSLQGNMGWAYVYVKPSSGWHDMAPTAQLTPSDGSTTIGFGAALAYLGDTIAVGAAAGWDGLGKGYLYVEPPSGWQDATETLQSEAPDGGLVSNYAGVGLNSENFVLGTNGYHSLGALYVYGFGN